MSATASPVSLFVSPRAGGRRLASESSGEGSLAWRFKRNCSLTPLQCLRVYALLCALSLGIAAFFYWQGAPLVLPFAGLEMLGLGVALAVYARHASDRESIELDRQRLRVEHRCGTRLEQAEFDAAWVRVEPASDDRSLLELSGQGRRMAVGRYLRPELRAQLADELRQALRVSLLARAGTTAE